MEIRRMKAVALKWWISLAVIACIGLASGVAFAQNGQGLAAVGAISPANPFPRWYTDRSGLQLGQCLDTANPPDGCALIAAGGLPNPAAPVSFPGNFPGEFFYWRSTADIAGIGGNAANRARIVLSTQGGFGGPTLTPSDGAAAAGVFARSRIRVPAGLTPGATYTFTGPFGVRTLAADAAGTVNFTVDQGCIPTPGAVPPPCNFAAVLATTNVGPFLTWDPAVAPAPPAGFIGNPAVAHAVIGSPVASNFFRIEGADVGGPGVNLLETNQFLNVIGKLYVRPATTTSLTSTPNPSIVGQAVTLTATVTPAVADALVPGGTVAFRDGATVIGTATLVNGRATLVTSALAVGTHSLTVAYSGDLDFSASTSAAVTQTVNAAAPAPPPPAAGTDTVSINRAELVVGTGELRVEGTTTRLANGSFAASVEIHDGPAVGGACTGALIATTPVNAGSWAFRATTTFRPTTVCVKSAGGGVSSRAVTQK